MYGGRSLVYCVDGSLGNLHLSFAERESELWEPLRVFYTRLREFEQKSSSEILQSIKNSLFITKKAMHKAPDGSKEIPPVDVPELLAYLVRQSSPFLDQLGIKKICLTR